MVDIKFFRASTVTHASLSERGGLADRGFAHELSEASCTSGDAEVLTAGALSLRVCARVVLHTTVATTFSPQTAPIWFRRILLRYCWWWRGTKERIYLTACKKGAPGLWTVERLSDGQVSPRFKSKVKWKREYNMSSMYQAANPFSEEGRWLFIVFSANG